MMHICTVATLCFPDKTIPRNYYYCVQDDNSLCLCFKSMYRILFVAIFTSAFIFSMFKSSHTYRNINISNLVEQLKVPKTDMSTHKKNTQQIQIHENTQSTKTRYARESLRRVTYGLKKGLAILHNKDTTKLKYTRTMTLWCSREGLQRVTNGKKKDRGRSAALTWGSLPGSL